MSGDAPRASGRNATKARVERFRSDGIECAAKRCGGAGWLARWLLRREARILAGMPPLRCVPRLVSARADEVVTEWVDGAHLFDLRWSGLSPAQRDALRAAVAELHGAGFAHGDIGRHDVVFRADGTVALLDFATAVGRGTPPLLWRILLPLWRAIDRRRVERLCRRYGRMFEKRAAQRAAKARGGSAGEERGVVRDDREER